MTIKELFQKTYLELKNKAISLPHMESSWLIEKFCSVKPADRILHPEKPATRQMVDQVEQALKRRKSGEPLAYILGEKDFYGITFEVNKNVLIPRPETELLIDWVLDWVSRTQKTNLRIADLGTGSGCIGLTLLKKIPQAQLIAIDISDEAVQVAKKNAHRLDLLSRAQFFTQGAVEWLSHFTSASFSRFMPLDLIVANPPYIAPDDLTIDEAVKKYEPAVALFAEGNGLAAVQSWSQAAATALAPKGAI
jgi:release factor glutamine methyltransferase